MTPLGSEIPTTGLTGCSSPVEVWALPLRLEWLEILAWFCRKRQHSKDNNVIYFSPPLTDRVWFPSVSLWVFPSLTFPVPRTVWRRENDSPSERRAARQLWPQRSVCFSARCAANGTLQARVVEMTWADYCCGTRWTRPPWWSPSSGRWDRWDSLKKTRWGTDPRSDTTTTRGQNTQFKYTVACPFT